MSMLDGLYDALDEVRFFWDGADVINMVISLCRRQYDPMGNITATVDGVGTARDIFWTNGAG